MDFTPTDTMEPGLTRWIVSPSMVKHRSFQILVEQIGQTIRFSVDQGEWNTYIHSYDYNKKHGTDISDGWLRIHEDSKVCDCFDQDHLDTYCTYDCTITMKCLEKFFLEYYETRGTFPNREEIKDTLRPIIQVIKSIRTFHEKQTDVHQEATDAIFVEWNSKLQEYMHRVKRLCKNTPFALTCMSRVGNALIDRYSTEHQYDMDMFEDLLDKTFSFLQTIHWEIPKKGAPNYFVYEQVPKCPLIQETLCDFLEIEEQTLKEIAIVEALYALYLQRKKWLWFLTIRTRLLRWKYRAIRNQNHPDILAKRGVFGHPMQMLALSW